MNTERGEFITLEGGEGVGKTTQLSRLQKSLNQAGIQFISLREPGGTKFGDKIRKILLDPEWTGMTDEAELLLFGVSRAELVTKIIIPALESGMNVICDRFYDSTTAYQGYGRGIDLEFLEDLRRFVTRGLEPDLTICLDIDPNHGLSRATKEGADRIEAEAIGFHLKVREGFLVIARQEPERVKIVDASGTPEEVHARVWAYIRDLFNLPKE